MLGQIGTLLVETIIGLVVYLALIRFYMQAFHAPFRNPVGELVTGLTNWAVLPLRRVIPGLLGLDVATLLLAWLAQGLLMALLMSLNGYSFASTPAIAFLILAGMSALELLVMSIKLLMGAAIVQAILSFVAPDSWLMPLLNVLTRRFYAPFRRLIPAVGGFDLSPLFLLLACQIALIVLDRVANLVRSPF